MTIIASYKVLGACALHWLALNNYASLTINVRLSGAPTDFWALDPVALFFGSVGVSAQAPQRPLPDAEIVGEEVSF